MNKPPPSDDLVKSSYKMNEAIMNAKNDAEKNLNDQSSSASQASVSPLDCKEKGVKFFNSPR